MDFLISKRRFSNRIYDIKKSLRVFDITKKKKNVISLIRFCGIISIF